MCSLSFLRPFAVILGILLALASVVGIAASIFLIFGKPLDNFSVGTYKPSWEDIGPALISSVASLVVNVVLIGGAVQKSKNMVLVWIIWKMILLVIFWIWYGYNQLKHHGYVEWRGMRGCYFCGLNPEESYVGMGGAIASFVIFLCLMPIAVLHAKFKRIHHREMAEPEHFFDPTQPIQYHHHQSQLLEQPQQQLYYPDNRQYSYQYQQQHMPMMEYKY